MIIHQVSSKNQYFEKFLHAQTWHMFTLDLIIRHVRPGVMESQVMCMSCDQPCDLTPEDQNMPRGNTMVRCCNMLRQGVNTINSLSINSTELSAPSHWTTCINKPQLLSRKYTFFFPFLPFDSFPPWSLYTGSGGRLQKP